jgi:hypothetical protein
MHLPTINPNGIVNGTDLSPNEITVGTTVTIFGNSFGPADTVLVVQGTRQFTVEAGSPWWYDSPTQINATLPSTLVPGLATVYVLTSAGLRSAGQTFTMHLPTINPNGIVNGTDLSPNEITVGTTVTIYGNSFGPADTVLVVQGTSQYTVKAGSPWWYDSPTQINASLPDTLVPGQATVYVLTSAGLRSAGQTFTMHLPTINPNGVVNGSDYSPNDIYAGTTVTIFGNSFGPADTVLVVQGTRQYTVKAGSPWWYDSPTQINATLPSTLVPGLATVYVLTSAGLRSNGQPIIIQPIIIQ